MSICIIDDQSSRLIRDKEGKIHEYATEEAAQAVCDVLNAVEGDTRFHVKNDCNL